MVVNEETECIHILECLVFIIKSGSNFIHAFAVAEDILDSKVDWVVEHTV